jgi:hypothetical protein
MSALNSWASPVAMADVGAEVDPGNPAIVGNQRKSELPLAGTEVTFDYKVPACV